MNTDEVADVLELTAQLMELHDENPFKIRSLVSAAYKLSKSRISLEGKTLAELETIDGIGKGIAQKIIEIAEKGITDELKKLKENTPEGLLEVLKIKGLGPKKVRVIWQELGIESVGELEYACNENRLVELKGFGEKTQESIKKNIAFLLANQNKQHYAYALQLAFEIKEILSIAWPSRRIELSGEILRKCEVINKIELLVSGEALEVPEELTNYKNRFLISFCSEDDFVSQWVKKSGTKEHLDQSGLSNLVSRKFETQEEVYKALGLQYIEPELREGRGEVALARMNQIPKLIVSADLKGVLHNHSTYSDGVNTLAEMAEYCLSQGYQYFGIADHSQSAFYANGMKPERVMEQHQEIDLLNKKYSNFKIFKGIESDILNDGNLDYEKDILQSFDFVVASVHSNLKMSESKATDRLIKAIEHPETRILGHPSGRLLLAREGYPLDYKKIIDACSANKVVIELNAHPYRLDLDWRWIYYCIEKNVLISINPDAHVREAISDMQYGINVARKAMLTKENCLNAMSLPEFTDWIENGKK